MTELSNLLRVTAERQGIEGVEIARQLGLSQSMVSDILNGKKKNTLPPDILKGFGRVLGLSQVQMMVALGYVDEAEGDSNLMGTPLPSEIAQILGEIDWSDRDAKTGALSSLRLIRNFQKHTPQMLHDPSEVDRRQDR